MTTNDAPVREVPTYAETRKKILAMALVQARGNRTHAAKLLEVTTRTIHNWLKEFEMADQFPPVGGRRLPIAQDDGMAPR